ncbi:putative polyketide synthase [Diaporthe ampelina]|uniref:Putative polyketide synthase n=1 Tax=Diaporthe ampelina TaxID=1214573 RepID=A0A0G2HD22_9PEZI|nr:putative polyketide synthase [Diaporthe ampelina]
MPTYHGPVEPQSTFRRIDVRQRGFYIHKEQKIEDTGKVDYEAESTPPTDFAQRAFHDKILTASVARSKPERILKMGLRQGDRVPYFEGDLREPRLGLSEADGVPILGQVDAATHNGADTSHLQALP